jgi:hypothetical protein
MATQTPSAGDLLRGFTRSSHTFYLPIDSEPQPSMSTSDLHEFLRGYDISKLRTKIEPNSSIWSPLLCGMIARGNRTAEDLLFELAERAPAMVRFSMEPAIRAGLSALSDRLAAADLSRWIAKPEKGEETAFALLIAARYGNLPARAAAATLNLDEILPLQNGFPKRNQPAQWQADLLSVAHFCGHPKALPILIERAKRHPDAVDAVRTIAEREVSEEALNGLVSAGRTNPYAIKALADFRNRTSAEIPNVAIHGPSIETTETMPSFHLKERRPHIWNPFSEAANYLAVHPSLGEGEIAGDGPDGLVDFKIPGSENPCRVPRALLTPATDRDAYEAVVRRRMTRYPDMPLAFAILVLRQYLAEEELRRFSPALNNPKTLVPLRAAVAGDGIHGSFWKGYLRRVVQSLHQILGIDPVDFALKMAVGEMPDDVMIFEPARLSSAKINIRRHLTTDLIRGFVMERPWQEEWKLESLTANPVVRAAGHYYPQYYRGNRSPDVDLTDLYFAYRERDEHAMERVVGLMKPLVDTWKNQRPANGILVPMIGSAPNEQLAERLAERIYFPWQPRPANYGQGVEGQRASVKMRMVQAALKIQPDAANKLMGASVLIIDDNLTDGITYIAARKLLLESGAKDVSLAVLTRTLRRERERDWI